MSRAEELSFDTMAEGVEAYLRPRASTAGLTVSSTDGILSGSEQRAVARATNSFQKADDSVFYTPVGNKLAKRGQLDSYHKDMLGLLEDLPEVLQLAEDLEKPRWGPKNQWDIRQVLDQLLAFGKTGKELDGLGETALEEGFKSMMASLPASAYVVKSLVGWDEVHLKQGKNSGYPRWTGQSEAVRKEMIELGSRFWKLFEHDVPNQGIEDPYTAFGRSDIGASGPKSRLVQGETELAKVIAGRLHYSILPLVQSIERNFGFHNVEAEGRMVKAVVDTAKRAGVPVYSMDWSGWDSSLGQKIIDFSYGFLKFCFRKFPDAVNACEWLRQHELQAGLVLNGDYIVEGLVGTRSGSGTTSLLNSVRNKIAIHAVAWLLNIKVLADIEGGDDVLVVFSAGVPMDKVELAANTLKLKVNTSKSIVSMEGGIFYKRAGYYSQGKWFHHGVMAPKVESLIFLEGRLSMKMDRAAWFVRNIQILAAVIGHPRFREFVARYRREDDDMRQPVERQKLEAAEDRQLEIAIARGKGPTDNQEGVPVIPYFHADSELGEILSLP
jgi:hypothetical protein